MGDHDRLVVVVLLLLVLVELRKTWQRWRRMDYYGCFVVVAYVVTHAPGVEDRLEDVGDDGSIIP